MSGSELHIVVCGTRLITLETHACEFLLVKKLHFTAAATLFFALQHFSDLIAGNRKDKKEWGDADLR